MVNCPNCGTEMKKTNYGRYICPNCGIDNSNLESEEKEVSYIG